MRRVLGGMVCAVSMLMLAQPATSAAPSGGGVQRWSASYQLGAPASTSAVAPSPDGSMVFVTGRSAFGFTGRFATLAYDSATGDRVWAAGFPSADSDETGEGKLLAVSPDGSTVFVSGSGRCLTGCGSDRFDGVSTLAYDASSGRRLWVARLDGLADVVGLQVSPDGSAIFVSVSDGDERSALVAYEAASGVQRWRVDRPNASIQFGGLAVSKDGSMVFNATPLPPGEADCLSAGGFRTEARDTRDGTVSWSATHSVMPVGLNCGAPMDMDLTADGETLFVAGSASISPTDRSGMYQAGVVAYDTDNGERRWARSDADIKDLAGGSVSIVASPDGSKVFLAGDDCAEYPACSFSTVAYDTSTGHRAWLSQYHGGGRGYLQDLAVSPNGAAVYVTGQESMPCFAGCTVSQSAAPLVSYDSTTGTERWATAYPDSVGSALAVSPDSASVYLAGSLTLATSSARSAAAGAGCSGTCGYSTARYNAGAGPGAVQDTDMAVHYGGWRGFFHKTARGGAFRASRTKGDTATFRTPAVPRFSWLTRRGPNQGMARIVIDGRRWGTVNLYHATRSTRAIEFDGLRRVAHTVTIKVLGTKAKASRGAWVALDGFSYRAENGVTEEHSPRVSYGPWAAKMRKSALGGSLRLAKSPRARVRLTFAGRSVTWVTATGPAYGRAKVVIDGKARIVDLYSPIQRWQVPVRLTGLDGGTHRLTVTTLGRKNPESRSSSVAVDVFVVRR